MLSKTVIGCSIAALILGIATCCTLISGDPQEAPLRTITDADAELTRTRVVGALDARHEPGQSLMWCATVQMAWDELSTLVGDPIRLESDPPLADSLNRHLIDRSDLVEGSYVARAGLIRDGILDTITEEMARRFPGESPGLPAASTFLPESVVAYAFLSRDLQFEKPLLPSPRGMQFGDRQVWSFGLWHESNDTEWGKRARQLQVLHYESPEDFAVEITTVSDRDRLLFVRTTPGATLLDTIQSALQKCSAAEPSPFDSADRFAAPVFNFDLTRTFGELLGKPVLNQGFGGFNVTHAVQSIRFRLDQRGALLKSRTLFAVGKDVAAKPRYLILEGPFLTLMMKKGATLPYFALWVENDELMVPHESR